MPECESTKLVGLVALYCIFGVSSCVVFAVTWLFCQSFFTALSKADRKQPLNVMAAAIVFLIALERLIRLPEIYVRFHGDRGLTFTLDMLGNACHVIFVFLTMYHQIYRLDLAFRDSIYSMKPSEQRLLLSLVGVCMSAMIGFLAMRQFDGIVIEIVSITTAVIGILCALCALFRVQFRFGDRLQKIVAIHTAQTVRRVRRLTTISSETANNRSNDPIPAMDADDANEPPLSPRAISTLARTSTVNDFPENQHSILHTVSRGAVLSGWITFGIMFLFAAVPFLMLGDCSDWESVSGHLWIALHCCILACCMFLSLKSTHREYLLMCHYCDRRAADLSATLTQRKVHRLFLKSRDSSGITHP